MICKNCGAESDILIEAPNPSCPACCAAPMADVHTVHTLLPDGDILVTHLGRLGWRWTALQEDGLARWQQEQAREQARSEPADPWWKRLLNYIN